LADPAHKVREAAASTLRKLKDARAFDALAKGLLEDPHPDVRGACAQALGELEDPRALESLELATRTEQDVFTIILIERAILKVVERTEGGLDHEGSVYSAREVRLPSSYGIRVAPPRTPSTFAVCAHS